jgi:hypothetical protein
MSLIKPKQQKQIAANANERKDTRPVKTKGHKKSTN